MSSRNKWLILAFSLIGLGFAAASSWVHYKLLTDPTYITPCDISATFNCSQVYLSRFGAVWGVPVALAGMFWFAVAALLAGFADTSERDRSAAGSYLLVWSVVGLASVLYLGYASFAILRTGCVLCIGTYVAVAAVFVLSAMSRSVPVGSLAGRVGSDLGDVAARPAALGAAAMLIVATVGVVTWFPTEGAMAGSGAAPEAAAANDFASAWAKQPRVDLGIPADGAKVVIVKFNDYECGACRAAEQAYQPVLQKFAASHPGAVKYVIKDWPWDATCNFNASGTIPGHEAACDAAVAMRVAKEQGQAKAQEMETWIYANQGVTRQQMRDAAAKILGVTDFEREYTAKLPGVRQDIADGGVLRIDSTPTYFINGVRLPGGMIAVEFFELAINLELNRAS